jgi:4-hydroxy-tetrahydrodipicolinate reductase
MDLLIFGDGPLGRAIAGSAGVRGWPAPTVLGRPAGGGHRADAVPCVDVVIEASRSAAVASNLTAALAAGNRRFVIATTAWETDRVWVERLVAESGATAIVAPNLSLGVALFGRLVDAATDLFGPLANFDPFIVEWHRRGKADRPSGTARALAERILDRHPRLGRIAGEDRDRPAADDELEVAVVRAGASPGMHLIGFDAPGETVELKLTARDRSAYAAGALAAVDWITAHPRQPGLHPFDAVVDDLLSATGPLPVASAA